MSRLAYLRSEIDAVEGTIVVMNKKDADWLLSRVKGLTEAGWQVYARYDGPFHMRLFSEAAKRLYDEICKAQE